MNIYIGQKVRHKMVNNGRETLEVTGIRVGEVELKGNLANGRPNAPNVRWFPTKGLIFKNMWGS